MKVPYLLEPAIERDAEVLLAQFCGARGVELLAPIPVEEILEQHLGLSLGFDDLHARFDVPQMGEEPDVPGALFVDRREVLINQVLIRKIIQTERVNDDARRAIGTDKGAVDVGLSASVWRGPRAI